MLVIFLMVALIGCSGNEEEAGTTETEPSTETDSENQANEEEEQEPEETETSGGELIVGMPAQPPTLDGHMTTSIATAYVISQVYETLVTINSNHEMVPMLAESVEESEDGLTYTFHLREGVTFHNGEEMEAEDVVASLERWKDAKSGLPQSLKEGTFNAVDTYTVTLEVDEPSALIMDSLASHRFAYITPKEVIEAADESGIQEYIGTGPFEFVEWVQDQYIHVTKYEDYQPVDLPKDGLSGHKEALVDDIFFQMVPDAGTQVAGVQSGEYDVVLDIPNEYYEQVSSNSDLKTDVTMYGALSLAFNKHEGIFTDPKMRQAVNAALDMDSILLAAFANEDLFEAGASYMQKEQVAWYSEAGSEHYNQNDPEKAKQLLEEAGYNGEEIVFLTSRDYDHIYNSSVVVQQQLADIGMNVELAVYDWATFTDVREDPSQWSLYSSGNAAQPTPTGWGFFGHDYFDGPNDDKTNELLLEIERSTSQEEAKAYWDELQAYLWETVPMVPYGYFPKITVTSNAVEGYEYFNATPIFWNVTNSN